MQEIKANSKGRFATCSPLPFLSVIAYRLKSVSIVTAGFNKFLTSSNFSNSKSKVAVCIIDYSTIEISLQYC
jgi:hypothetical protein